MMPNEVGKQLHDRATRGEALSEQERQQLEEWYTSQDRAEMEELGLTGVDKPAEALQAQVEAAVRQLAVVSRRIQQIAEENESLRRENATLRRQLVQETPLQPI